MCVCVCKVGRIDEDSMQWNASLQLQAGGTWSPPHCVARQRVAVIIPFRDRAEHLATLLPTLHAMLQGQQLHYTVYVVEQAIVTVFLPSSFLFVFCEKNEVPLCGIHAARNITFSAD